MRNFGLRSSGPRFDSTIFSSVSCLLQTVGGLFISAHSISRSPSAQANTRQIASRLTNAPVDRASLLPLCLLPCLLLVPHTSLHLSLGQAVSCLLSHGQAEVSNLPQSRRILRYAVEMVQRSTIGGDSRLIGTPLHYGATRANTTILCIADMSFLSIMPSLSVVCFLSPSLFTKVFTLRLCAPLVQYAFPITLSRVEHHTRFCFVDAFFFCFCYDF